jgi:hypothetical protein
MLAKKKDGRSNLRAETKEFTERQIKELESLAGFGFNEWQLAEWFDISRATLQRRMADFPEIYAAIHRGRIKAKMNVRATMYQMATSGKNTAATMFWLKFYDRPEQNLDPHPDESGTDSLIGAQLIAQELAAAVANMSEEEVARELKTLELESKNGVYKVTDE